MVNHTAVKLENEKNSNMLSDNVHLTNFTIASDNVTDQCVFKETKLTSLVFYSSLFFILCLSN
jgi:hypothetical protein